MTNPEARTRKQLIDPALKKAGWDVNDRTHVGIEIPADGYNAEPVNGITDYILLRENGEVLAVVEAKKTTHDPRLARQQTEHYLKQIAQRQSFRPFGFMTNGEMIQFWDSESANPRAVQGFFSRTDLERLLSFKKNGKPLTSIGVNSAIVNRPYQIEGVKRICEAFQQGKRKTLMVMATGTGKTRTAMAIIDLFMRTQQAQNVLFVADRDALVTQALSDGFKKHIPNEPCIRIRSTNLAEVGSNRLFAVTLQTLHTVYRGFNPGFFDLIIFDEVHRSIFNLYEPILDYFDGRMIGLTATPAEFVDRNTFLKFDCTEAKPIPTFSYDFDQAIKDGYLVNYRLYKAQTRFQELGIRADLLTEEDKNALIEQGIDPDELDYSGTDLENKVTNKDTLRRQWQEIMDTCLKDKSGQLPGKMIVFALSQAHAVRLVATFEEMYPQWLNLAQVITSQSEYHGQAIEKFKKEEYPRIAVSVNMLETGVDVPEVVNLVFLTPVQSRIKMAQMIGRGTRTHEACHYPDRLPNGRKTEFLILDFADNDFERHTDEVPPADLPVLVSLFNTRLKILERYLTDQRSPDCQRLIGNLRALIKQIPLEAYPVQQVYHRAEIQEVWGDPFWHYLTQEKIILLQRFISPLLRYVAAVDVPAATFTHKIERVKLQQLEGKKFDGLRADIADDLSRLPNFVTQDVKYKPAIDHALFEDWEHFTAAELDELADLLATQMRNKRKEVNPIFELDLQDRIASRKFITLTKTGEQVYIEEYRQRVETRITELVKQHPTLQALERGEPVTTTQLVDLERHLRQGVNADSLELDTPQLRRVYGANVISFLGLLRKLLDLDPALLPDYKEVVDREFERFIAAHNQHYRADQVRFLRAIKEQFNQRGKIELADLYEPPFTSFGTDAVDRLFTESQITEILTFTDNLVA